MPTCLVDALAPHVGEAATAALEAAACRVEVPDGQACCGQPAMNVGLVDEAREMAGRTLDAFSGTEGPVVVPSGSCAEMIVHQYPRLFAGTEREEEAIRLAERVRELTRFLVTDLGAPVKAACDGAVAYQYSCHGLRGLGLDETADRLLEGTVRVDYDGTQCCGFGGLFSVAMPDVSGAIMGERLDAIEASGADYVVGGDVSCLLHIEGGLRKRGSSIEVRHIAELLAPGEG